MKKLVIKSNSNMKSRKSITAAESDETTFNDIINDIKDRFDYLTDGLELLDSQGAMDSHVIAQTLSDSINDCIQQVADIQTGGSEE